MKERQQANSEVRQRVYCLGKLGKVYRVRDLRNCLPLKVFYNVGWQKLAASGVPLHQLRQLSGGLP